MNWSAQNLAERAGVHLSTVQRMERRNGPVRGHATSLDAILIVFDANGIEFVTENGKLGVFLRADAVSDGSSG